MRIGLGAKKNARQSSARQTVERAISEKSQRKKGSTSSIKARSAASLFSLVGKKRGRGNKRRRGLYATPRKEGPVGSPPRRFTGQLTLEKFIGGKLYPRGEYERIFRGDRKTGKKGLLSSGSARGSF